MVVLSIIPFEFYNINHRPKPDGGGRWGLSYISNGEVQMKPSCPFLSA